MISRLVHVERTATCLDEEEILATVFLMFLAGHVTTVNLVGNGVVALLTHPDQLAKLKANPELLAKGGGRGDAALLGAGRLHRPAHRQGGRRGGRDGDPERGRRRPASLASANRDPERFANPEVFDITRPDANRHVAFGKGIHVCLGAPLARVEGQVAFATLFRRYPELRLAVRRGGALG
jgi:cytochrome P450